MCFKMQYAGDVQKEHLFANGFTIVQEEFHAKQSLPRIYSRVFHWPSEGDSVLRTSADDTEIYRLWRWNQLEEFYGSLYEKLLQMKILYKLSLNEGYEVISGDRKFRHKYFDALVCQVWFYSIQSTSACFELLSLVEMEMVKML